MPPELNAIVSYRLEVASGLMILRITPSGWELPSWTPGQFAVLGLADSAPRSLLADAKSESKSSGKMIRRAYSIASSNNELGYFEFYISLVQSGRLTPHLFALQPGDWIFLSQRAYGSFTLQDHAKDKHLVLIATGTGLAPYMSMLRSNLDCRPNLHTVVLLGARHSQDLGYLGELIAMQRYCPTFHVLPVISRPDEELLPWSGTSGYIQDLWDSGLVEEALGMQLTPEQSQILLCGNPSMIESMINKLGAQGFREDQGDAPGQLYAEKYW